MLSLPALGLGVVLGVAVGVGTPPILRRLPEPAAEPEPAARPAPAAEPDPTDGTADVKISYAELATPRFAVVVGVLTAAGTGFPAATLPIAALPAWLVLGTIGVLLAAIDARTTWVPLPLTRIAWVAMAVALGAAGLLGGGSVLLRGVAGFGLAGAVFGLVWLLSRGGIGFGDVRYAPLIGAATASVSWSLLAWALVLGSLTGALMGLLRLAVGRRGAFAYAPSILAGGYLAAALEWLTT